MKKLFSIFVLSTTLMFAQDVASVASVQFSGTGLSDLETKTLYNYFMGELEKASDGPLLAQETVDQSVSSLDLTTNDCFKKDCLIAAQDATSSNVFLAGTLKFSKNKYRVKLYKVDSSNPGKSKSYRIRYKGDTDGFITELEILAAAKFETSEKYPKIEITLLSKLIDFSSSNDFKSLLWLS